MRSFAVIPAAGRSRRMGQPKLLLPWENTTVIEHTLAAWRASRVDVVVVVVHPDDRELAKRCRHAGATVVVPPQPPPEMKDSVACALEYLRGQQSPQSEDVWLLAPADVPRLSAAIVDRLLDEQARTGNRTEILVPVHDGRRGHPVLFPWPLADEVARLAEQEGVNALLDRHAVREVDCGPAGVPGDLDTPDDYRRLRDA
jgi:molybdenum cofactor cytidylyltransferase